MTLQLELEFFYVHNPSLTNFWQGFVGLFEQIECEFIVVTKGRLVTTG